MYIFVLWLRLGSVSKKQRELFVVIGFVPKDSHRPIQLFNKEQANHLMGESHLRKRQHIIGSVVNSLREAIRTTNHKGDIGRGSELFLEMRGKVYRAELLATLIQQNQSHIRPDSRKNTFALHLFLLFKREFALLDIRNNLDFKRQVMRETLLIVRD